MFFVQVLSKWHQPRVAAVIAGGVDLIAFDTIPAGLEALALAHLLETEFPDAKAWISFSCKVRGVLHDYFPGPDLFMDGINLRRNNFFSGWRAPFSW